MQPDWQMLRITPPAAAFSWSVRLPPGWAQYPLPDRPPDFDQPATLMPAGLFASPDRQTVFTVAARPSYADGSPRQWLDWICQAHQFQVQQRDELLVAGQTVPAAFATQPAEGNRTQRMRLVLVEDAGRIFIACGMTDGQRFASELPTLEAILRSFAPAPPMPAPPAPNWSDFARGGGAGAAPNTGQRPAVVSLDLARGFYGVQSSALNALCLVPGGWISADQSDHLELIDPAGAFTVVLRADAADGISPADYRDDLLRAVHTVHPEAEFRTVPAPEGEAVEVRGLALDDADLRQIIACRQVEWGFAHAVVLCASAHAALAVGLAWMLLANIRHSP